MAHPKLPVAPADVPDADLAQQVRDGNNAAFAVLVERHQASLRRRCRRLLGDSAADDAVQQALLRALEALRGGAEVRQVGPWLHRIARNLALNELSARRTGEKELTDAVIDRRSAGLLDCRADLRAALRAVAALPARQHDALLAAARGESHTEIAARLGVTEVSARQILCRARAVVRAAIGGLIPAPVTWLLSRVGAVAQRLPAAPPSSESLIARFAVAAVAVGAIAAPAGLVVLHAPADRDPAHVRRVGATPVAARFLMAMGAGVAGGSDGTSGLLGPFPLRFSAGQEGHGQADAHLRIIGGTVQGSGAGGPERASAALAQAGAQPGSAVDETAATPDPGTIENPPAGDSSASEPSPPDPTPPDPAAPDPTAPDPTASGPTGSDPTATNPTVTDTATSDTTATGTVATDPTVTDTTVSTP